MSIITKIVGWITLAVTEIMILIAFFSVVDKAALISSQVIVFGAVWGSVAAKNFVDMKRDQIPEHAKEL